MSLTRTCQGHYNLSFRQQTSPTEVQRVLIEGSNAILLVHRHRS